MTEAERAQLWAMRHIIDALLLGAGEGPKPATEPCRHQEVELSDESTLGHAVYRCVTCRATVEPPG